MDSDRFVEYVSTHYVREDLWIITFEMAKLWKMRQYVDPRNIQQPMFIDVCERVININHVDNFTSMFGNEVVLNQRGNHEGYEDI